VSYTFGDFSLDVSTLELRERGSVVQVPPKVLDVLTYLIRNRQRVVSQEELRQAVWSDAKVTENSVAQAVASIRRLLHDKGDAFVRTIHTRGYRFVALVEQRSEAPASAPASNEPPFVGRAEAIERMVRSLRKAASGRGDVILLTGPAGIGKTRCVREFVRRAVSAGAEVRQACFYEEREGVLEPWRQLLSRSHVPRSSGPPADAALFAGFDAAAENADLSHIFSRAEKRLAELAQSHSPLVLVLEDLNWSDAPSLLFLKFVARHVPNLPVLIVATYRDSPIAPALAKVLGFISRDAPDRRIALEELDATETATLAAALLGPNTSPKLVEHLWHKTGGNPLFLVQLFHVVSSEHIDEPVPRLTSLLLAPETVREAIVAHLASLSSSSRELLSIAAVFGRQFSLALLTLATKMESASLLEKLDEARAANIISLSGPAEDAFRFRYAVMHEVLYRQSSLPERAHWHWAFAEAMASLYDLGSLSEPMPVAEHFVRGAAAGPPDSAARWLARAAMREWQAHDRETGVLLLEHAMTFVALTVGPSKELVSAIEEAIEVCVADEPKDPRIENIARRFQRGRLERHGR